MMKNVKVIRRILAFTLIVAMSFGANMTAYARKSDGTQVMVSMGDSYSSGEGIPPFYGQQDSSGNELGIDEKINNYDWLAHRSTKSWSGKLTLPTLDGTMADHRNENWFFVAASGAETMHVNNLFPKETSRANSEEILQLLPPQIEVFNQIEYGTTDYVTLTMGGNNVGFSDIIVQCVTSLPSYINHGKLWDTMDTTWEEFEQTGGTKDQLTQMYKDIANAAGPQATILVAGYPKLFSIFAPLRSLGLIFDLEEVVTVNENVVKFNRAIESIVSECKKDNINIEFVPVADAFEEHGAYSADPYINPVIIPTQSEDLKRVISSPYYFKAELKGIVSSSYSIHPNELGAKAYAKCVQRRINELEGLPVPEEEDTSDQAKAEAVVYRLAEGIRAGDLSEVSKTTDPISSLFWGFVNKQKELGFELVKRFFGDTSETQKEYDEIFASNDLQILEMHTTSIESGGDRSGILKVISRIPEIGTFVSGEATIHVKFQYKVGGSYQIGEQDIVVKRYPIFGWRVRLTEEFEKFLIQTFPVS